MNEQENKIEVIKNSFLNMHFVLKVNCQENKEIQLALEKLEEAQFWAIKGIKREETN